MTTKMSKFVTTILQLCDLKVLKQHFIEGRVVIHGIPYASFSLWRFNQSSTLSMFQYLVQLK